MDQIITLTVLFSGMFSLCDSHQYKFLNHPLKWTEAQKICRQKYIDLASINGVEDVVMLLNAVDSNYTGEAFIGLYFKYNSWQWSLTDSEFYKVGETEFRQWGEWQPNNGGGNEYCVLMSSDGTWSDYPCSNLWYFMCYNDSNDPTRRYILIEEGMNWTEAQRYCREHYRDLVSVRNESENDRIKNISNGNTFWIGLFIDPWKWSDQENTSYRNWNINEPNNLNGHEGCAAVLLDSSSRGKWDDVDCSLSLPFFCYNGKRVLMKLSIVVDNGLNPNDPEVSEYLLAQFREQLSKHILMENTTLRWREWEDGVAFHQEEDKLKEKCDSNGN